MLALVATIAVAGAAYAAISGRPAVPVAAPSHGAPTTTGLLQRDKAFQRSLPGTPRSDYGRFGQLFRCGNTVCQTGTICCFNNHNGRNYCCPRGSRCAGNGGCV
jgi:hypothetical protein